MKILVISEYYPTKEKPFSGRYIKQQMDEFIKLGHEVDVLIPLRNSNSKLTETNLSENSYFTVGYLVDRYELFPLKTAKKFAENLENICLQNRYDLISVHLTSDTLLANIAKVSQHLNIPFVQHYHGLNVWEEFKTAHPFRQKVYAWRRNKLLKKSSALVGVSDKVSDVIRERLPNKPVYTIYNGVNVDLFDNVNEKINFEESKPIKIVSVGRLIYTKGHHLLIDAVNALLKEHNDLIVEIVGDGPEMEKLNNKVLENNLQEKIILSGRKDYSGVAASLKNSDLFVLPSYYEALGCVYLEAMACGLPAIGVKGMGIDEIIEQDINGYLVEPDNVDDLIFNVQKYLKLTLEEKKSISQNAYKTALKYTWKQSAINLEKVYKNTLSL